MSQQPHEAGVLIAVRASVAFPVLWAVCGPGSGRHSSLIAGKLRTQKHFHRVVAETVQACTPGSQTETCGPRCICSVA